jgi:tetratricopeptide (TPR) repeat protein
MAKLDYLQEKKLNPAAELRELLSGLEERQVKIKAMGPDAALEFLQDLDRLQLLFEQLEATDLNLLPEQGRFASVQASLKKSVSPLLKAMGGPAVLNEHRPSPAPPPERWWWYIDELVAVQKRRTYRQLGLGVAVLALVVGAVVLAFKTILAPSPEVAARIEAENTAFSAIDEGNLPTALEAIEAGLTKAPDEPSLLLLKGVLQEAMGQKIEATESFARAERVIQDPLSYHLGRSQLELRLNQPEKAESDVRTALEIDGNSPTAWLILGQALELQEKTAEAVAAYQKANELAFEYGDNQVVVLARLALARLVGRTVDN